MCQKCYEEVVRLREEKRGATQEVLANIRPQLFTHYNHMDIGPVPELPHQQEETFPELDALTFFEEEILSPVQPMMRVYTLYGTGLTEMRGHVANWTQGGPLFVREIPVRAFQLNLLLIRRFPRDPNRKQRVPFIASPSRLRAALDRLEGKLDSPEHKGMRYYRVVVNRDNLQDYREGEVPDGLHVQVVDQKEELIFDRSLLEHWLRLGTENGSCLELSVMLFAYLRRVCASEVPADATSNGSGEDDEVHADDSCDALPSAWYRRAWRHVRQSTAKMLASQTSTQQDGATEADQDRHPADSSTACREIKDETLAQWLLDVLGNDCIEEDAFAKLLGKLRDELTVLFEHEAAQCPLETSGTWEPDDVCNDRTQEELIDELRAEVAQNFGSAVGPVGPLATLGSSERQTKFDTTNMTPKERASLAAFRAARLRGVPFC